MLAPPRREHALLIGHAYAFAKPCHSVETIEMLFPFNLLAQQQPQMPTLDSMYWIMLGSRVLHILGAIILAGGLFYLRFVVSPISAPPGTQPVDQFFGGRRAAWAKWVGIATAILLFTGFWNYVQFSRTYDLPKTYHMVLGFKILAAIAVFLLAALLAGRTHAADSIRQNWRLWINVCLLLAVITVVIGSVLRTYPHNHKIDAAEQPTLIAPANQPAG
jgi:uncharacterized membrane protein